VLDRITAPQNIFLPPSPTRCHACHPHPHPVTVLLSPSPPAHPVTAESCKQEHPIPPEIVLLRFGRHIALSKMAAMAAQYYFRFRICYRCLQKVKVYEQTKFRRHISIDGRDIATSIFDKQTSAILEIYFRFPPLAWNLHIILQQATKFCPNRRTLCENMTSYPFLKDGGRDGWILLPVSYLLMLLPSEGQSLLAN